jgi:hypothetical protein
MASWPAGLPDFVLENGYLERLPENKVETNMDAGKVKMRRRFTMNVRSFSFTIMMTEAQAVIFEEFYETTLASGSLAFDWVHPRTRGVRTFRFRKPPPSITMRGEAVMVSCAVETVA